MKKEEIEADFNSLPEFIKSLSKKDRNLIFDFVDFINQPVRDRIIRLSIEKPMSISELQRELDIGYKSVWEHVKKLENKGVVKTENKLHSVGNVIMVSFDGNITLGEGKDKMDLKIPKNFFLMGKKR